VSCRPNGDGYEVWVLNSVVFIKLF
jgi:hypothetical protein